MARQSDSHFRQMESIFEQIGQMKRRYEFLSKDVSDYRRKAARLEEKLLEEKRRESRMNEQIQELHGYDSSNCDLFHYPQPRRVRARACAGAASEGGERIRGKASRDWLTIRRRAVRKT